MRFGIFSNGERGLSVAADSYDRDLREIVAADRMGYDEAWISEHLVLEEATLTDILPSADLLVAKAAALTSRIRLGPAVRALALHHPVRVAAEVNTCDHLTRGRYLFGYGTGKDGMFPQLGIAPKNDPELRRQRMREALELMIRCWTESEPFDFSGRFWRGEAISVLPRPWQTPHVPLAVATKQAEELEYAAERGIGLLVGANDSVDQVRRILAQYRKVRPSGGGGRPLIRVCRHIYVSTSRRQALKEAREGWTAMLEMQKRMMPWKMKDVIPPGGGIPDITLDYLMGIGHYLIGGPEEVLAGLQAFYDAVGGFDTLLLLTGHDYAPPEWVEQSLTVFAQDVAPQLSAWAASRGPSGG
ncbi:MAG: LLM class flavin-dependent oxidoreductase [Firmicutes bacterium]|nr:LLM class flavin-dependent oxidoreductase [Bacillota bacterium]